MERKERKRKRKEKENKERKKVLERRESNSHFRSGHEKPDSGRDFFINTSQNLYEAFWTLELFKIV